MNIAYFECFSGISGDMIIGALIDLGLDPAFLTDELAKLNLTGYRLSSKRVKRCGISGTKFDVTLDAAAPGENAHHRKLNDIAAIINQSNLNENAKKQSLSIFQQLARAEAKAHGVKPGDVHFHEVGAVDSIVDVVGSVIGLQKLGFDKILFSPIAAGSGYVECAHGRLPVPVPATAELLNGCMLSQTSVKSELATPTGAAIITTLGEQVETTPAFRLSGIGYGAGNRDNPELPNLLRILSGVKDEPANGAGVNADEMWVVEANIDDMPGELLGNVIDKLMDAGAVDAYLTPIQMKKSRPAVLAAAIAADNRLPEVEAVFFDQTTTFGVRKYKVCRKKLDRETVEVETSYGNARVKIGKLGGKVKSVVPEYEDCKKLAKQNGAPLKDVYNSVVAASTGIAK